MLTGDTGTTLTLACDGVASAIVRALEITITWRAAFATHDMVVALFTSVTVAADHMRFACAVPCQLIARHDPTVIQFQCARWITLTQFAAVFLPIR